MKSRKHHRKKESTGLSYACILTFLILFAFLLAARLGYIYLADAERHPITAVKVAAHYEHITHKEIEEILVHYVGVSFFMLPVSRLQQELNGLSWVDSAYVERIWPDTLKIKIIEKVPVAIWGNALMTAQGELFNEGQIPAGLDVPRLQGPKEQQSEVLQVYKKLSKILTSYHLVASGLQLNDNQSWVVSLTGGAAVYLGKNDLEARLLRFCKAYPAVFAEKAEQLASVDLRYPRGMAVQWKQQTGR